MTWTSDLKQVQSFRKKHILMIFLCSGALFSMVYRFTDDAVLAGVVFSISFLFMGYAHLGGFIQGLIVQSAHGGASFPPSNLDNMGYYGIRTFNAWKNLKEEQKIFDYNCGVADEHTRKFIKDFEVEKTEE